MPSMRSLPDNSTAIVEYLAWKGLAPAGVYVPEEIACSVRSDYRDRRNNELAARRGAPPASERPTVWAVTLSNAGSDPHVAKLVFTGSGRIAAVRFYERPRSGVGEASLSLARYALIAEVEVPHWNAPLGPLDPLVQPEPDLDDPEDEGWDPSDWDEDD